MTPRTVDPVAEPDAPVAASEILKLRRAWRRQQRVTLLLIAVVAGLAAWSLALAGREQTRVADKVQTTAAATRTTAEKTETAQRSASRSDRKVNELVRCLSARDVLRCLTVSPVLPSPGPQGAKGDRGEPAGTRRPTRTRRTSGGARATGTAGRDRDRRRAREHAMTRGGQA